MSRVNFDSVLHRLRNPKIEEIYTKHIMVLSDRLNNFSEILSLIEANDFSRELINDARKNLLLNLVTYFETWMKRLFISMIDEYSLNIDKVTSAVDKKLKFQDLIKTLKSPVSIGKLTAEFINFQNINSINKFYSELFDEPFFEEIRNSEKTGMKPLLSNFYPILREGIEKRHEIIHNFVTDIKIEEEWLEHFHNTVISFTMSAMGYCNLKLKDHLGYNPDILMVYLTIIGELEDDGFSKHVIYSKKEHTSINDDEKAFENIMEFIKQNEPDNLIDFLKKYINKNQDEFTAILYLANIYLHYDSTKNTEELLKKTLLMRPNSTQVWQFYFEDSLIKKQIEKALTSIQRALTFDPKSARSWFSLSILFLILNKQERVKQFLLAALKYITNRDSELMFIARDLVIFNEKYNILEKIKEILQSEIDHDLSSDLLQTILKIEKKYKIRREKKEEWGYIRFF